MDTHGTAEKRWHRTIKRCPVSDELGRAEGTHLAVAPERRAPGAWQAQGCRVKPLLGVPSWASAGEEEVFHVASNPPSIPLWLCRGDGLTHRWTVPVVGGGLGNQRQGEAL